MFKKNIIIIACVAILNLCSIFSSCILLNSYGYCLEKISYSFNDYNTKNYKNYVPSRIYFDSKQTKYYDKLYDSFCYNSFITNCCVEVNGNYNYLNNNSLKLLTQKTFWVSDKLNDKKSNSYYLDYGLCSVYFKDEILSKQSMLSERWSDSDTFVYVSDTTATSLCEHYGITADFNESVFVEWCKKNNRYDSANNSVVDLNESKELYCNLSVWSKLIMSESYSKLEITDSNGDIVIATINNIIHSDTRRGTKFIKDYGDFCFIYMNPLAKSISNKTTSLRADVKVDPFGTSKILDYVKTNHYDEEYNLSFYIYDYTNDDFVLKEDLVQKFVSLKKDNKIFEYIFFGVVFLEVLFAFFFTYRTSIKGSRLLFISSSSVFAIYGVVANFIYIYPLFSIPFICLFIYSGVVFFLRNKTKLTSDRKMLKSYYEIEI